VSSGTSVASPGNARRRKFRQAAFVYLHVGVLYEAAVLEMFRGGLLGERLGPTWIWLGLGMLIVALVFWGLWSRQNAWLARVIWALGVFRLPPLIGGAFFPIADARLPPSFYLVALVVVTVNLWMLARAGWDL
jgi:hypothetical protein